jgi:putative membrane protein
VSSSRFPRNGCWRCWRCAAAAVALLLPLAAPAQQPPRYAASAAAEARPLGAAQRLERHFLQVTAASLRLQAEASQLALARTNNPAVKELAELLRLLAARGMAMPLAGNEHNKVLKQLSKLNGAKFDRLYVDDVVLRTLQADVANFDRMSTQAEDKVLKTWVDRQLPLLRAHLDRAGKALPGAPLRGQRAV